MRVVEIDGARGEGGGQMLRIALFLAALTGTPFRIYHLRSGRAKPGLKRSHLVLVNTFSELLDAEVRGAHLGSYELYFKPRRTIGNVLDARFNLSLSTGTASSVTLMLQPFTWLASTTPLEFNLRLVGVLMSPVE